MTQATAQKHRATAGMERSFASEVRKLTLGADETFHGEAILAITKALLQAGVAYVGGYPGAPVSHLMDVLAEAREEILEPMGVHFEASASEAGSAAMLGASIHYPLRGAVTWKSIVGTNVASDALSNLASAGVTGGALIVIGEDYGEGASVIQERTHATALKSSIPLIDPRYDMQKLVDITEQAFELSEACHLPVFMSLRIRAAHMTGSFIARDNQAPPFSARNVLPSARYDYSRIVLPPSTYTQEKAKFAERLPAARRFITDQGLNEQFPGKGGPFGIVMQGGTYGVVMRGLRLLGAADIYGRTDIPLQVLNVIHPLVPEEVIGFMRDKQQVLVVEEGNPPFIQQQLQALAHEHDVECRVHGKNFLPEAGEYVADVVRGGLAGWLAAAAPDSLGPTAEKLEADRQAAAEEARRHAPPPMPQRPPSFCTGCPERPLFTALKLLQEERGRFHISADIGCSTFATLPPFNMGSTVLGYGLSLASSGAVGPSLGKPSVAVMGDGAFWHNGLATGAAHAHWNRHDAVLIIIENGYASATGQQHVPSTGSTPWGEEIKVSIEEALRGLGLRWIRRVDAYDVSTTLGVLREAFDEPHGLRVVISDEECMLARQRRERKQRSVAQEAGKPVVFPKFGVDEEVCTGDHSCMRMSGCPSLTLRPATDPLKDGPTATVDNSCVACGLCGSAAQAAGLCPSFYRAERVVNASAWRRLSRRVSSTLMDMMGAS